MGQRNHKLQCC